MSAPVGKRWPTCVYVPSRRVWSCRLGVPGKSFTGPPGGFDPGGQPGGFDPQQPQPGGFDPQQPQPGGFDPQQPQPGGFDPQQPQPGGFDPQQPQPGGFDPGGQPLYPVPQPTVFQPSLPPSSPRSGTAGDPGFVGPTMHQSATRHRRNLRRLAGEPGLGGP